MRAWSFLCKWANFQILQGIRQLLPPHCIYITVLSTFLSWTQCISYDLNTVWKYFFLSWTIFTCFQNCQSGQKYKDWRNVDTIKVKVLMIHTFKCQIWSPHIALRLIWSSIWVTLKSSFGQLPKSLHRWRTHLSNYLSQDLHLNWISIKKQDLPVNVSQCTPCVISSSSI